MSRKPSGLTLSQWKLTQFELYLVAIHDHRQHRLTNYFFADLAESLFEAIERHHRFRHGAVPTGAADVIVEPLHNLAGALDVANIADRNHHPVFYQTGDQIGRASCRERV